MWVTTLIGMVTGQLHQSSLLTPGRGWEEGGSDKRRPESQAQLLQGACPSFLLHQLWGKAPNSMVGVLKMTKATPSRGPEG